MALKTVLSGESRNERTNCIVLTGPIDRMKSTSDLGTCREGCQEPNYNKQVVMRGEWERLMREWSSAPLESTAPEVWLSP